jgi:hypothetical protein
MMQPFPMDGHYRTDVISGVGHPGLNSVVSLVLRTVCFVRYVSYNCWGTDIVLQVPRDSVNPAEKG